MRAVCENRILILMTILLVWVNSEISHAQEGEQLPAETEFKKTVDPDEFISNGHDAVLLEHLKKLEPIKKNVIEQLYLCSPPKKLSDVSKNRSFDCLYKLSFEIAKMKMICQTL